MFYPCRQRRHLLIDGADFRKFFYQVLDVTGDVGEDHIAEGGGERTRENRAVVTVNTSRRWIHRHLELAHKINAQDRAVYLTLDKIETKTVRAGVAVSED